MHGQHERGAQSGQHHVGALVVLPVPLRPPPAERERAVDGAPPSRGSVPDRGEVGDQPREPETEGDGEVGADREHVPDQGRAEVHPEKAPVGIGHEPVGEPGSAEVDQREQARGHDREDRHGLGGPVDGGAPALAEEVENRRDEGSGVPDADPEDEVRDIDAPADRVVDPEDPDPLLHLVSHDDRHRENERCGDPEGGFPEEARRALHRSRDFPVHVREALSRIDQGLGRSDRGSRGDFAHVSPPSRFRTFT